MWWDRASVIKKGDVLETAKCCSSLWARGCTVAYVLQHPIGKKAAYLRDHLTQIVHFNKKHELLMEKPIYKKLETKGYTCYQSEGDNSS